MNDEKLRKRVIRKSCNDERLFEEKITNLKYKKGNMFMREKEFTLSMEEIIRENHIQILT